MKTVLLIFTVLVASASVVRFKEVVPNVFAIRSKKYFVVTLDVAILLRGDLLGLISASQIVSLECIRRLI